MSLSSTVPTFSYICTYRLLCFHATLSCFLYVRYYRAFASIFLASRPHKFFSLMCLSSIYIFDPVCRLVWSIGPFLFSIKVWRAFFAMNAPVGHKNTRLSRVFAPAASICNHFAKSEPKNRPAYLGDHLQFNCRTLIYLQCTTVYTYTYRSLRYMKVNLRTSLSNWLFRQNIRSISSLILVDVAHLTHPPLSHPMYCMDVLTVRESARYLPVILTIGNRCSVNTSQSDIPR